MIALVTGAAGFIGSTLVEKLLADGHQVRGIDGFTDYYDPAVKAANLVIARAHDNFVLVECDLRSAPLYEMFEDVEVVFHLAAQPGVRRSWDEFDVYVHDNVLVTQRMLEAARASPNLSRFIYASSSSVYGNAANYPTVEDEHLRPQSPYGVTKLAAEQLCKVYASNWTVPTTALRLFTVYGPRQRPDMAIHRLCRTAMSGSPFTLFGDGSARRSFAFIEDVVDALRLAGSIELEPGTVVNIAGNVDVAMSNVVDLVRGLAGTDLRIQRGVDQAGDVQRTGGNIERARALLGWTPRVSLEEGLRRQLAWHRGSS